MMPELPEVMHAAYVEELGAPEQIRYGQLPVPRIGPTDVLVAVEVVTVDPVDTFVRSGAFPTVTTVPDLAAAADVLNQRLAEGTLSAQIADTMPLADAAEAHRRVAAGHVSGARLILRP